MGRWCCSRGGNINTSGWEFLPWLAAVSGKRNQIKWAKKRHLSEFCTCSVSWKVPRIEPYSTGFAQAGAEAPCGRKCLQGLALLNDERFKTKSNFISSWKFAELLIYGPRKNIDFHGVPSNLIKLLLVLPITRIPHHNWHLCIRVWVQTPNHEPTSVRLNCSLGFRSTSAAGVLGQLEPALLSVFKLRFRVSNSSLAKPSRLSHLPLNSGPSFRKQVFHKTKLMVSDMRDIPQCLTSRLSHNTFATAFEDLLAHHGATYSLDSLKSA